MRIKAFIEIGQRTIACRDALSHHVYIDNPERETDPKADRHVCIPHEHIAALGGKVVKVPDIEPGEKLLTSDGDWVTFIGPNTEGTRGVVTNGKKENANIGYSAMVGYFEVHWNDVIRERDVSPERDVKGGEQ